MHSRRLFEPGRVALRPHHLTCLFFYVGKGYSEAFGARMDEVSRQVRQSDCRVVLTGGRDAICEVCPHWRLDLDRCAFAGRVARFDERTLAEYGLRLGGEYVARELMDAMFERFDVARFERICGDCDWRVQGVCDPSALHGL